MIFLYIAASLAANCTSFPVTADPSNATTLTETFTVPTKSGDTTTDNFKVRLNESISTYTIKATDNAKVTIEDLSKKATIKISGPVWVSLPEASADITLEVEYNLTSKATPFLHFTKTDKITITESFAGKYDSDTNYTFAVANMVLKNSLKNFTLTKPKADTKFYVLNMCEMIYTAAASSSRSSLVDSTNFTDVQVSELSSSLNAYSPDASTGGAPGDKKWKPGAGEIIAIVFCVIMVLLLILLILYFACCDKRRKARQASNQQESKPVEKKEEDSLADNRMVDSDSGSGVNV